MRRARQRTPAAASIHILQATTVVVVAAVGDAVGAAC